MKNILWKDLNKKYRGLWVALNQAENKVYSSGKLANVVYLDAKKKGLDIPVMYKVPQSSGIYVGSA